MPSSWPHLATMASDVRVELLLGHPPGVVLGAPQGDLAVDEQRRRALGVGRREDDRQGRATISPAVEGCPLHPGGVHDRADVVHAHADVERPTDPVREARATLVEVDDAQVARQAMHETGEAGLLPVDLHVRDPGVDDDEGERPRAEVLVGDRGPVDSLRPAYLGDPAHHRPPFIARSRCALLARPILAPDLAPSFARCLPEHRLGASLASLGRLRWFQLCRDATPTVERERTEQTKRRPECHLARRPGVTAAERSHCGRPLFCRSDCYRGRAKLATAAQRQ